MARINLHIGKTEYGTYRIGYTVSNERKSKFITDVSQADLPAFADYLRTQGVDNFDVVNRFMHVKDVKERLARNQLAGAEALVEEQIALFGLDNQLESVKEEELASIYQELKKAIAA